MQHLLDGARRRFENCEGDHLFEFDGFFDLLESMRIEIRETRGLAQVLLASMTLLSLIKVYQMTRCVVSGPSVHLILRYAYSIAVVLIYLRVCHSSSVLKVGRITGEYLQGSMAQACSASC